MRELRKFLWLVKDHHQAPLTYVILWANNSMIQLCDLTILSVKIQVKSRGIPVPDLLLITFPICTTAIPFHAGKFASNLSHSPKYIKMELNIPAHK